MVSYQTFVTFPSLCYPHTLFYFINFFRLIKLSSSSNFCHLLTLSYLLTFYVIYAPYTCTCTTHLTAQLSHPSYRTYVCCTNTPSPLNRRLPPSSHSGVGGPRHDWGFYPRTNSHVISSFKRFSQPFLYRA